MRLITKIPITPAEQGCAPAPRGDAAAGARARLGNYYPRRTVPVKKQVDQLKRESETA